MKKIENKKLSLKIFALCFVLLGILFFSLQGAKAFSLVPCDTSEYPQPCTLCHLVIGFKNIFDYLISSLFVVFTLGVVIAGIFYMVSSGSKTLVEKAKTALTYSLMGAVIALTSWLLVNAVLHALGYKSVGSWYNFTCDTTPSTGPGTTGAGGATLPKSGQGNTAMGDGNCGGVAVAQNSDQCKLTSKALDETLTCIKSKVSGVSTLDTDYRFVYLFTNKAEAGSSLVISSLGLNRHSDWQTKCVGENYAGEDYCSHVQYSCHFGGRNCQGQVNAADLQGSNLAEIAAAARACNASGSVIYGDESHKTHVHVSVNKQECGC